jgi:hypothetical protein
MTRRIRLRLSAALAACAAALALGQGAAAETATFDLTVAGISLGTVTLEAQENGPTYVAKSRITPNSFVQAVTGYAFDGQATGEVSQDGEVTPIRFEADSTSPRATRRTEIEWRDGRPVHVSVVPQRKRPADPAKAEGALDPVSAGFALLRDNAPDAICDRTVEVFDGSRRSRLTIGKPTAEGEGFVCAGTYVRVEGEAHTMSDGPDYPFTLVFGPKGEGQVKLERIETQTRFGRAVVSRRG